MAEGLKDLSVGKLIAGRATSTGWRLSETVEHLARERGRVTQRAGKQSAVHQPIGEVDTVNGSGRTALRQIEYRDPHAMTQQFIPDGFALLFVLNRHPERPASKSYIVIVAPVFADLGGVLERCPQSGVSHTHACGERLEAPFRSKRGDGRKPSVADVPLDQGEIRRFESNDQ